MTNFFLVILWDAFFSSPHEIILEFEQEFVFFKKKLRAESLKSCCGKRKDFCMSYYTFSLLSARCFLLILS